MELKAAWIFVGDQRDKKLHLAASRGVSPQYLEDLRTHGLGECLCPEVFWTGHRMQARNTTDCPRMPDIVDGLKEPVAHACIPMKFEGATKGVLNVAALPGKQFWEEQLRFLETLGHQVGLAVERARHREEAARLYDEARRAYQELKDAQQRILSTEKMVVLGTFAAGLAHEIRNPLNSIGLQLSSWSAGRRAWRTAWPSEIADLTGVIHEEVKRLEQPGGRLPPVLAGGPSPAPAGGPRRARGRRRRSSSSPRQGRGSRRCAGSRLGPEMPRLEMEPRR